MASRRTAYGECAPEHLRRGPAARVRRSERCPGPYEGGVGPGRAPLRGELRPTSSSSRLVIAETVPSGIADPVNAAILRVSEDQLAGFYEDPFAAIAQRCGLPAEVVCERLRA